MYDGTEFALPEQLEIDAVELAAKKLVASGQNLKCPKAIPLSRGRPCNDAGKRKEAFYEQGAGKKKRAHTCSYCGLTDHERTHCPLRQQPEEGDGDGT